MHIDEKNWCRSINPQNEDFHRPNFQEFAIAKYGFSKSSEKTGEESSKNLVAKRGLIYRIRW